MHILENDKIKRKMCKETKKDSHRFDKMHEVKKDKYCKDRYTSSIKPAIKEYDSRAYQPCALQKSNTVDVKPSFTQHRKSRYEEIKERVDSQFSGLPPRGNTFEVNPEWSLGKENDMNSRNVTFARSDSNHSTIKSTQSLVSNKKLQKLEKLYNELSMLENSVS